VKKGLPMWNRRLFALLVLALAAPASAQRRWAGAAEYELYQRAYNEVEPTRQIGVLLEWEADFPSSEFQRERMAMLILAYKNAGRPVDAFARATQLFKLDSTDINGSYMVATLAPSLKAPSPGQIRITEEAANNLLSRAPEIGRAATAVTQPAMETTSQEVSDPERERVVSLIRQWRRGKRIRTAADVEGEIRRVAERALAWAKSNSK
jgi:hypothetical protein